MSDELNTGTWSPGLYQINKLVLFSINGQGVVTNELDLHKANALITGEIRQGIYGGSIEATFVFNDAYNASQDFNQGLGLQGEEYVDVSIQTPEAMSGIDLQFLVESVKIDLSSTNQTAVVTLYCFTKEILINSVNNVNQSFEGTTSDIAKNIFNNRINGDKLWGTVFSNQSIFKQRPFGVDTSVGIEEDLIVPGLSPFAAVDMMGRRSDGGPSYKNSLYCFFETTNGYQFRNIQKLIEQNTLKNESKKNRTYTYRSTDLETDNISSEHRTTIKKISPTYSPSPLSRLSDGIFKNHTRMVDVIGKSFKDHNYTHDTTALGSVDFNSTFYKDTLANHFDREYLFYYNNTKKNQGIEKLQAKRVSFLNFLNSFGYVISLSGDCSLQAGEVIEIDIPPPSHIIEDVGAAGKYSGQYLVIGVTHNFDPDKLITTATVVKDSLNTKTQTHALTQGATLIT